MSGQGKIVTNQVPVPFIGDEVATTMVPPSRPIIPHNEPSMADLAAMSPQQLTLYLTTLIVREWKKSATCLYPSRNKVVANLMLSDKEVAVCHVKFRCEDVPRDVVAKVRHLAKLGVGEGEGCFDKFMALLKKEVRLVTFEDDVNSPKIDRYKGVSGAVEMLAELAIYRVQMDIDYDINTDLSNKVVFKTAIVDGRGLTYTYTFSVLLDARFTAVVRDLNRRFPRLCNPRCDQMISRWQNHVRDLKQTGMGEHPKLALVEQLITEHLEAPPEILEEWMYIHELSNRGDCLRGEDEFRALMKWAADCVDHQPKGCLMRVMEAKMREIFSALKIIDEDQNRIERRNEPTHFVTTPPKPLPKPQPSKSTAKKPRGKAKPKAKGKGKGREETTEDVPGDVDSSSMPWNMEDLTNLGFEKEGTVSPKKLKNKKSVKFGQNVVIDNEPPMRVSPRKQTPVTRDSHRPTTTPGFGSFQS